MNKFFNVVFAVAISISFSPVVSAGENSLDKNFPTNEMKTQEIKRLIEIQRSTLRQKILNDIRALGVCVQVPEFIQNFSCRISATSSTRRTYDTPQGFDCVSVNEKNPRWGDYEFCQLQRQNREDFLKMDRERLIQLDDYETKLLSQVEVLNDEAFKKIRVENLRKIENLSRQP